jgi:hypothetical protein
MPKLIPIAGLRTFQEVRAHERDESLLEDRKAAAERRRDEFIRRHALEDLATALLHAKHAENQSPETVERIRRHG